MDAHAWMDVVSWLIGGIGFVGLGPALMSPVVFTLDDPQRPQSRRSVQLLFACIVSFPLACMLALAIGWALQKHGDARWGLVIACAPLLNVCLALACWTRIQAAIRSQAQAPARSSQCSLDGFAGLACDVQDGEQVG